MEEPVSTTTTEGQRASRFELAPPRRFVLPAVLLLLSEQPGYGYSLEKDLRELNFGKIDRPTVYRALAHLEKDGLVGSWEEAPKAGQARRVYGVTPLGERVLRVWMSVIKEERDCLGRVLRRYQATGTLDAALAEVEGGWATALGSAWSPVSPTSGARRLKPVGADRPTGPPGAGAVSGIANEGYSTEMIESSFEEDPLDVEPITVVAPSDPSADTKALKHFRLVPDRSVVMIEVRSTVGPISFGALGVTGSIEADVAGGAVRTGTQPSAHVEIAVDGLRSGNRVYDAELLRRIDARRYPLASIDLRDCVPIGTGNRYRLGGELTFHGVTRPTEGAVNVEIISDRRLRITGEQMFDIRDFAVPSPTVLMLRIYPDVRVRLHVEADLEEG